MSTVSPPLLPVAGFSGGTLAASGHAPRRSAGERGGSTYPRRPRSARVVLAGLARVRAGERTADVAADLGLPATTLAYHVRREGIPAGRRWHLRGARAVAAALAAGATTAREVSAVAGVTLHTAQANLERLDRRGLVTTTGRQRCALLWTLTDAGRAWLAESP